MKTRLIGLAVLLAVITGAAFYAFSGGAKEETEITGYVGGEKIGLLEDEEVIRLMEKKYGLRMDYAKAGSMDMVTADHSGRDFLFPSSQTALELYEKMYGKPVKSEIVLNTPIVLYTRKTVADALEAGGIVTKEDGVSYVDMERLTECVETGVTWEELGLPQLYGSVTVGTTDPNESNSGNMFAGLLANVICGGVADSSNIGPALPRLRAIFQKLGYMETSSSDLFDQFLKTGMGAKPLIAGYENQLLEFAVQNPADWKQVKGDIVMLYPNPTVWSAHVFIALDENGALGIDALTDEEVQELAWKSHGFRTGVYGTSMDAAGFGVDGVAEDITRIAPMPDVDVMQQIMEYLE